MGERRKRITAELIGTFLADLWTIPIRVDSAAPEVVFGKLYELCRQYGLTPYDAAYLELAERCGLPLATLDHDLRRAGQESGVGLI